jgi:hypothetical protein
MVFVPGVLAQELGSILSRQGLRLLSVQEHVKRKHEITLKSSLTSGVSKCHSLPTTFAVELSAVVRKNIRSQELTDIIVAELGVEPLDVDALHIAVENEPITMISQIKQDDD